MRDYKVTGTKVSWLTAYDFPLAYAAEKAGINMILVGDSGGMVQLGYSSTNPVTMDEMILLSQSVRRGAPNTFVIGDMPQGSYEVSTQEAIRNALRFVKEAGCDCIKLEGGMRVVDKVKAIVDAGILSIGHLGLTPQSAGFFSGYTVQGKTMESFDLIMKNALALQEAGICCLLLEAMPSIPAGQVAKNLNIPVYGIGAGSMVDGQLLIMHDLLGLHPLFRPKFAKCYIPDVLPDLMNEGNKILSDGFEKLAELAISKYISEVQSGVFPGEEYSYPITNEELYNIKNSSFWK